MKDLNTNGILLEALRYHPKARAEFYLKKQIESGWSKSVFFSALQGSYHYWTLYLKVKRSKGTAFKDANSLPFANPIPDGPQELTIELLNDLLRSVKAAINWDKPKPEYSGIRVISMIQFSIGFIYNQFMMQANKKQWLYMLYSFPKEYKMGMYLFNTYAIGGDQIFFDFNRFRDEVRSLYFTTSNTKAVETMLEPTWKIAVDNVELWNNEIYPISYDLFSNENPSRKVIEGHQILNIDPETFALSHPINHQEFKKQPHKFYQNQDFARFSENVANFLGHLMYNNKSDIRTKNEIEASHREIILAHEYKYKCGYIDQKSAADWKAERGNLGYQQYYTTLKRSKKYKATTTKELNKIIQLLEGFPAAQILAINELEHLQSL